VGKQERVERQKRDVKEKAEARVGVPIRRKVDNGRNESINQN